MPLGLVTKLIDTPCQLSDAVKSTVPSPRSPAGSWHASPGMYSVTPVSYTAGWVPAAGGSQGTSLLTSLVNYSQLAPIRIAVVCIQ